MVSTIEREYNVLNECRYIRNKDRCVNDTNTGYELFFTRGLGGWDQYENFEASYTEGYFLWGIVQDSTCSVGRSEDFTETFEADFFGDFEVDMLIRVDPDRTPDAPDTFTSRIKWKMTTDVLWHSDAYEDFEVQADGKWHRYRVNLLEKQRWVGDCNNFIFYPTIDGLEHVEILIKRFAFRSDYNYKCKQPACAGNRSYSHPCPHIGSHARAYGDIRVTSLSLSNTKNRIGVSIDGHSTKYIDIDLNHGIDPWSVAQSITMKLNSIGVGGYKFAECQYDPIRQVFSIYSGTKGSGGSVAIYHGGDKDATEELGFYYNSDLPAWRAEPGTDSVDGYSPNYYKIPATLLYRLPNSTTTVLNYDPSDPLVEMGRSDLLKFPVGTEFPEGYLRGYMMIDLFGRCSYEGSLSQISYRGALGEDVDLTSKIFLLRPTADTSFKIMDSVTISSGDYKKGVYRVSVDWEVRPGDVFGLWQCLPAVHGEDYLDPEKLYKYSWIEKRVHHPAIGDTLSFTLKDIRFYGYQSLPVYGKSSEKMLDIGIEAELRYEYGVNQVAVIGEPDSDYITINLMDWDSTEVTIRTPNETIGPTPAAETDFYVDWTGTEDYFYIDLFFPGVIKDVASIKMKFNDEKNLRAFCWEWYVEPEDRVGFVWGTQYPSIETYAPLLGSETGWRRMLDPVRVLIDGDIDVSNDLYLGWNYVTDDGFDYFPGLTEDEQEERIKIAHTTYWTQLEQHYSGINTRGLRLNCWKALSAEITDLEVIAVVSTTDTLLHSVEAYGISGPLVFETEKYEIIDIEGEKYQSSNISRVQTPDYIYGMEFSLLDQETSVAPVGTTLRKLEVDVSGLPAKVQQIKIIPQHLAVQVKAEGDEPVEEITNLSWGMPSDGSEWSYGPVKSYEVCNDRGVEAKLILGVANPLAVDQACIFYSKLDSYESLSDPHRGLTAKLLESEDYYYSNSRGINYRSIVYGIIPATPVNWYSSTSSGVVWQTMSSGNPFDETILWSEPSNPHNTNWKLYNWAKAKDVSISDGQLNFQVPSRVMDVEGSGWRNPTYFQEVSSDQSFLIETQLKGNITRYNNIDSFAGIVLFDEEEKSRYVRIERYTGNDITASGYTHLGVPHGDYISYGDSSHYTASGGFTVLDVGLAPETNMLLRMAKQKNRVELAYKNPWDSWVTVSSVDLSGWSENLRMGLFVGAVDRVGDASDMDISASFNYLAYKKSSNRVTDFFNYEHDFEDFEYTKGIWTAHNPQNAEVLQTSPSGIYILNYIQDADYKFFDTDIETTALEVDWGGIRDQGLIKFQLADYRVDMLASGTYSAGAILKDTGDSDNYIKLLLVEPDKVKITCSDGVVDYFNLDYSPTSTSGVWLKMQKAQGVFIPSYSYDGNDFTVVSGYRIAGWSSDSPLSVVFSTDLPEIRIKGMEIGNSQIGAHRMAAEFADPGICLYNVWGRGCSWEDIKYTSSGTLTGLTTEKPDLVKFISFTKESSKFIDIGSVKFIPDIWMSKKYELTNASYEIRDATEQLFDRSGRLRPEVPHATSSGTWPSSNLSYKGLTQYDYPILVVDLGRTFEIGRCPLAAGNARGRFSSAVTGIIQDVTWDTSWANLSGFDRKCMLSSNNECTADSSTGKPIMVYSDGENKLFYYAGPCDGVETSAGPTYRACPLYSLGQARWILLEWRDYQNTVVSGGSIWFFGPITGHPKGEFYEITDFSPWWVTDYGEINWLYEDNLSEYSLIYSYPGLGIPGSCYFNSRGSEFWRLAPDKQWTHEDKFSVDLRAWHPERVNDLVLRVGRDPQCFYEFTVSGTLSEEWTTHSWYFKEGNRVVRSMEALEEPFYTIYDPEYYEVKDLPYEPLPFLNTGYVEISASGVDRSDIYIKNMKNERTRFVDDQLFLGLNESLYVPDLDLLNTGTIELDYYPSEVAINLEQGDPRDFFYCVLTVSNNKAGFSVLLHPYWGWTMYCHTPWERFRSEFLPVASEAERMLPTSDNSGPFHLVLTWDANNVLGRTDQVVLWIDGGEACSEEMESLGKYFDDDNVKLTLGRGTYLFDIEEAPNYDYAAYAKFSNLKVYKHSVPTPSAEIDSEVVIPENLIELSLDGNNWSSFLDGGLPLISSNVDHGECVKFYMRNKRPRRDIKALHKRFTAYLEVLWEVNQ